MEVTSSILRRNLALAIAAVGIVVALLAADPSPLVVTVAAICIRFGDRIGLGALAATGCVAYAILFVQTPAAGDDLVRLGSFLATALGIWLLIWVFRVASFHERVQQTTREIIENLPGLGWAADPNGHIRFFNPAGLEFSGFTHEQIQQDMEADDYAWRHMLHPDDADRSVENFRRSISTGKPLYDESRQRRHDGTYRWFRDIAVPTRDEAGRITGWYGTSVDIDDQKKAEEALRQSERELRLLADTVPVHIWMLTPEGEPSYYNRRLVEWLGMEVSGTDQPGESRLSSVVKAIVHPADANKMETALRRALAAGVPFADQYRLRRHDGEYFWNQARIEPLRDDGGAIIRWYGVNIDIDDEVKAQEALRLADDRLARASRAASLAELSVSIAHELNSPLQAVVANANAYQRWLSADPPNYERASRTAERIIRDANAAAEVIGRIRALFAQTAQNRGPVNLNELIREVCELVGDRLLSSNVRLELNLDSNLPDVEGDRVQLEQVVLNLVRNAIEAMDGVPAAARRLHIISKSTGDGSLTVTVKDHGIGIKDPERIFDAFYTTKEDGMGMGLSICRSIIEAHGGGISAQSAAGEGSGVTFTLPIRPAS